MNSVLAFGKIETPREPSWSEIWFAGFFVRRDAWRILKGVLEFSFVYGRALVSAKGICAQVTEATEGPICFSILYISPLAWDQMDQGNLRHPENFLRSAG